MRVKGIPRDETVWVQYMIEDEVYYITSKATRECYYAYKVDGEKAVKIGKSKSPLSLEERYMNCNRK